jgi:monoterpene epsilon-lactone hydrolase
VGQQGRLIAMPMTPDAIELRHLRAFVAVAEELNFSRAAERLYVSQPALSRQISALERLIGCDLLLRTTKRVRLTLAGEALLGRARPMLADLDDTVTTVRSVAGELEERVSRLWDPLIDPSKADGIESSRTAFETMQAQLPFPAEVQMRPVNAGGVPALQFGVTNDPSPTVLFLHGGGYVLGSALGYRSLASALAAAAGAPVLTPDYRLAPEHPYPAAVDDARSAYLWLLGRGRPPQDLTLIGDSTGSGLVLSLLLRLREHGDPLPGGAVLLSPVLSLGGGPIDDTADGSAQSGLELFKFCKVGYLAGHPADDPLVSPLHADLTGLPPLLIQVGERDAFIRDARELADRARRYGVHSTLQTYPVATHVFQLFWSFLPEAATAVEAASDFARAVAGNGDAESASQQSG